MKISTIIISVVLLVFNACSPSANICGKGNRNANYRVKKDILYKIYDFNKIIVHLYTKPINVVVGNIKNKTSKEAPIKDITNSLKYALDIRDIVPSKNGTKDYSLDIDVVDLDSVDSLVSTTLRFSLKDKNGKNIKNIIKKMNYKKNSNKEVSFTILNSGFNNIKVINVNTSIKIFVVLGVTELLGRVNQVPYWIVTKQKADETMLNSLTQSFLHDTLNHKILKISSLLHFKDYNIQPTRLMNSSLKRDIVNYKKSHNMSANNTISQKLYRSLLKGEMNDKTEKN